MNSYGLTTSKTDSNSKTTSYGYDSNGSLNSVTTPGSKVTGFAYNALGWKTSSTDALSRTTTFTLDNLGRVIAKALPSGGGTETFTYDLAGNLTGFTDATGTTTRTYDDAGRQLTEVTAVGTVSYAYNAAGQLTSITDPSGRVVSRTYDSRGLLDSVTESGQTTTFDYDDNGRLVLTTRANGATTTQSYDNNGQLITITNRNADNSIASSFTYAYDDDGKKTSATEQGGSVVSWTYNNAGRLIGESRTGSGAYTANYTVDGEGRRTVQTIAGVTITFSYDTDDALTSTSGGFANTYGFNGNGEQTSRTVSGVSSTLAWNTKGDLTSITTGGSTVSFGCDALGRRVTRTAGGATTRFVRSGDENGGAVLIEKQGSTTTKSYLYGAGGVLRSGSEWLGGDALGNSRTVWNGSGVAAGSRDYDAFGCVIGSSGTNPGSYAFAGGSGYRSDGDAGLMHVGAWYYDAQVGQFLSRDTYLDQKSYSYCEHDAVNILDPSGHDPFWKRMLGIFSGGLLVGSVVAAGGYLGDNIIDGIGKKHRERMYKEWLAHRPHLPAEDSEEGMANIGNLILHPDQGAIKHSADTTANIYQVIYPGAAG